MTRRTDIEPDGGSQPQVDIVLATFNGAALVGSQIQSIQRQTHRNWRLLVRDDGSTDGTRDLLERVAATDPDRIRLISDGDGNIGCTSNFSRLLEASTAPYVALCDQDDLWLPDKLDRMLDRIRSLEHAKGSATPLLVHSDLIVVDSELREISRSFWRYQNLDPETGGHFGRMLVKNVVTGCAAMLNASLRDLALPIPSEAKVHDWWLTLVAAAFGVVEPVSEPTVLYRQHGSNYVGAKAFAGKHLLARAWDLAQNFRTIRRDVSTTFLQAQAFHRRYADRLDPGPCAMLSGIVAIPSATIARRTYSLLKWPVLESWANLPGMLALTHRLDRVMAADRLPSSRPETAHGAGDRSTQSPA